MRTLLRMVDAAVLAPLSLAAVLALSGVAKLRDAESTLSVLRLLRLPQALTRPWVATALPWGEIALAALLVLAPSGAVAWVVAVATLGLMLTYLVVVARAMGFDPRPACGCFGRIGDQSISTRTVVRNVVLVAFGLVVVALAAAGRSTVGILGDLGSSGWWWVVGAVAVAALAVLVSGRALTDEKAHEPAAAASRRVTEEEDEYVPEPTPLAALTDPDGAQHTLWSMSQVRPQLLVLVNCLCGSTVETIEAVPRWAARLPAVDVKLVFSTVERMRSTPELPTDDAWTDHGGVTWSILGLTRSPSAVLLGVDRMIAGGPVDGVADVAAFVDDIADALSEVPRLEQVPADA